MSTTASRAGHRVGPFELSQLLGGAMGTSVYQAFRPAGSRDPRVVRVRIADDPEDERAAAWIRHEYDVLRSLDDPRIPPAHGYYASQVAIAIGHAESITLREAIDTRAEGRVPIDVATTLDILIELVHALRHGHGSTIIDGGVVHAALRPEVVELDRHGRVLLYGFGADPGPPVRGYAAPELEASAFVDPRTDQWALGALAVELMLGQKLYTDIPDAEAAAVAGRVGIWVDRLERRLPSLARVVGRLLAPAAGDRYADEGELLRELLEISRTVGGRADRAGLVGRVVASRPAPEPEPEPEPAVVPEPTVMPEPAVVPDPGPVGGTESADAPAATHAPEDETTSVAPPAPLDRAALPASSTLVPDPADASSVDVPAPLAPSPEAASVQKTERVAAEAMVSFDDEASSASPAPARPAETAAAHEPSSDAEASEFEITEVGTPHIAGPGPALGRLEPVPDDEPPPDLIAPAPAWTPMELVALSLSGLLVLVGLVYMVWRFG